jgi:hypothetical protein
MWRFMSVNNPSTVALIDLLNHHCLTTLTTTLDSHHHFKIQHAGRTIEWTVTTINTLRRDEPQWTQTQPSTPQRAWQTLSCNLTVAALRYCSLARPQSRLPTCAKSASGIRGSIDCSFVTYLCSDCKPYSKHCMLRSVCKIAKSDY